MTSFFKNLFGAADAAADIGQTPGQNLSLGGRAFRKALEETPGAVLLDVRTPAEFRSGTIPGAVNIDYFSPDFSQKIGALKKDVTYFVFCRSGNRSGQACKMMQKAGFDVRNLSGGIGEY
jgi:rhodanese-related sulfurtransferase